MGISVTGVFRAEIGAFLLGLLALLGDRMRTGRIDVRGLFRSAVNGRVRPERVLLFTATMSVGCVYIVRMLQVGVHEMPDINVGWLVLFSTSCAMYLGMKTFRTFRGKKS